MTGVVLSGDPKYLDANDFRYGLSFGKGMSRPLVGMVIRPTVYRYFEVNGLTATWQVSNTDSGLFALVEPGTPMVEPLTDWAGQMAERLAEAARASFAGNRSMKTSHFAENCGVRRKMNRVLEWPSRQMRFMILFEARS